MFSVNNSWTLGLITLSGLALFILVLILVGVGSKKLFNYYSKSAPRETDKNNNRGHFSSSATKHSVVSVETAKQPSDRRFPNYMLREGRTLAGNQCERRTLGLEKDALIGGRREIIFTTMPKAAPQRKET